MPSGTRLCRIFNKLVNYAASFQSGRESLGTALQQGKGQAVSSPIPAMKIMQDYYKGDER